MPARRTAFLNKTKHPLPVPSLLFMQVRARQVWLRQIWKTWTSRAPTMRVRWSSATMKFTLTGVLQYFLNLSACSESSQHQSKTLLCRTVLYNGWCRARVTLLLLNWMLFIVIVQSIFTTQYANSDLTTLDIRAQNAPFLRVSLGNSQKQRVHFSLGVLWTSTAPAAHRIEIKAHSTILRHFSTVQSQRQSPQGPKRVPVAMCFRV